MNGAPGLRSDGITPGMPLHPANPRVALRLRLKPPGFERITQEPRPLLQPVIDVVMEAFHLFGVKRILLGRQSVSVVVHAFPPDMTLREIETLRARAEQKIVEAMR